MPQGSFIQQIGQFFLNTKNRQLYNTLIFNTILNKRHYTH